MILGISKHNRPLLIAFALALAFLGHDLLMAAGAHTLGMHHAAAMSHAMSATDVAPEHPVLTHDAHEDGCATTRPVVQPPDDGLGIGFAAVVHSLADSGVRPFVLVREWWREPTAPPGVRRALSQVYRI